MNQRNIILNHHRNNQIHLALCVLGALLFCLSTVVGWAAEGKKAEKSQPGQGSEVKFSVAENYFVNNTVNPAKGQDWLVGIAKTQDEFDTVFGIARVMGNQEFLPDDVFDNHAILYFIQWGDTPWEFKVRSVVKNNGVLTISYKRSGKPCKSAQFAVPMILCVDKAVVADNPKIEMKLEKSRK